MKGAFRHQNIIIFLDPNFSLAHKTNSARKATIKNLNTFAENIVTLRLDVQYHPDWNF